MRHSSSRRADFVLAAFAFSILASQSPDATAQQVPWSLTGSAGDGLSVATPVADLDADGIDDLLLGAPDADSETGYALLVSGADGSVLATFDGDGAGDRFGAALAGLGDVDDDGTPDIAVGAPGDGGIAGYVDVYSGDDFTLLFTVSGTDVGDRFGAAVAGLGDVDSDGYDDLLVGAPGEDTGGSNAGMVVLLSGDDGSVLADAFGGAADDGYGSSIASWPTWKAWSGHDPDPIIGAPQAGTTGEGYVQVLDPSDLSVVRTRQGSASRDRLGTSVSIAGDVDADGWLDHLVGNDPRDSSGDPSGYGSALVLSGDDGSVIHSLTGTASGARFGSCVAGIGDIDGDGRSDITVASPASSLGGSGAGAVRVYSGSTGLLIRSAVLGGAGDLLGTCVVVVDDLDGDDLADLIVMAPGDDTGGSGSGSAWALSYSPWDTTSNGIAGTYGIPLAAGRGGLLPGTQVTILLRDALESADVVLVCGTSTVVDSVHGVLGPAAEVVVTGLTTDGNGDLDYQFTWPSGSSSGDVFYYQWRVDDSGASGGESLSNTLEATVP